MKAQRILIGVLVLALTLVLAVGLSQAEGPETPKSAVGTEEVSTAAVVEARIPIQGKLTDAGGSPINGSRSVTFKLYDVASGGTALCSDTRTVSVDNGLFSTYMANCSDEDIDGRQLYLGIQVSGDLEMTPRQAIYAVPYAWSLRPGAIISSSVSSDAIVHIENWGTDGRGLRAYAMATSGTNYGVVGASKSPDGYGGYFYNNDGGTGLWAKSNGTGSGGTALWVENTNTTSGIALWATANGSDASIIASNKGTGALFKGFGSDGGEDEFRVNNNGSIESKADSYVFVPGTALVKELNADTTRWDMSRGGWVQVWRGSTAGTKNIFFPITLPGVLYGQAVKIETITVYYKCENGSHNYISTTGLYKQTDADSYVTLISDSTNHTSNTATSYTLTPTANNVLSSTQGILGLYLTLTFANDTEYVQIGGVRIQLGHHHLY
jgi:hypothetical protein